MQGRANPPQKPDTRRHNAKAEEDILKLETEQAELSKQLEDPSAYADSEVAKDLNIKAARIAKYLEEKNYEWDLAAEELSKLD